MKSGKMRTLRDLLVHQLRDIYYAEKQIHRALGKSQKSAHNPALREAIAEHRDQTATHITRLETCFRAMNVPARGVRCTAVDGLVEETNETLDDAADEQVSDAALIACLQRVEHYEIAAYGCIRSFAQSTGNHKVAQLAEQTLDEEAQTDQLLTQIAESAVNPAALAVEGEPTR